MLNGYCIRSVRSFESETSQQFSDWTENRLCRTCKTSWKIVSWFMIVEHYELEIFTTWLQDMKILNPEGEIARISSKFPLTIKNEQVLVIWCVTHIGYFR